MYVPAVGIFLDIKPILDCGFNLILCFIYPKMIQVDDGIKALDTTVTRTGMSMVLSKLSITPI